MNKLKYFVKVKPIILNLSNLENEHVIHATNIDTKEKIPVCIIKRYGINTVTIDYYNGKMFNFEINKDKNNLIVITPKIAGNKINLEAPILIETEAKLNNLLYLTKFELSYSEGETYQEIEVPFFKTPPYFTAKISTIEFPKNNTKIKPEKVKLVGFYNNKVMVITDTEIFTESVFDDIDWFIRDVKQFGTKKREIINPYKISINYWIETFDEYYIQIDQYFNYYSRYIDIQTMHISIFDREKFLQNSYSKNTNLETELNNEEINILKDIKNFRNHLSKNLDSKTYFGAELIDKRNFVQKYSEEVYNTLIEAVITKDNLSQEIRQRTNRNVVEEIVKLTNKIDYITFHFIVNPERTDSKVKISLNSKQTEEKGEALVIVEVINPKEYMVQTNTVVRFYKKEFTFFEDLTKMFEVYDLKKFVLE